MSRIGTPLRWLLILVATQALAACRTPSSAAPRTGNPALDRSAVGGTNAFLNGRQPPEILDAGDEKLNVSLADLDVVLSSSRDAHEFEEVTYVISLEDDPSYNLQFTSAADLEDFVIRVTYKRLYRGTYTVRAFGDKSPEAFAEARFRVTEEGL